MSVPIHSGQINVKLCTSDFSDMGTGLREFNTDKVVSKRINSTRMKITRINLL